MFIKPQSHREIRHLTTDLDRHAIVGHKESQEGRVTSPMFRSYSNTKIYGINVQNPACNRNRSKISRPR